MKIYKVFGLVAAMAVTLVSCETDVDDPAGVRGVGVYPEMSNIGPAVFDSKNLATTYVQFTVNTNDPAVSEVVVVGSFGNVSRVEIQSYTTFPAVVKITLSDVVSKFGITLADVKLNDEFTFEVVTVKNGKRYYSNAAIVAPVVCAYDPAFVSGSYHAHSDDWGSDGDVTITVDPNDPFIVYVAGLEAIEGLNEDKGPLKMVINSTNFAVTAVHTVLASDAWGYHNIAYEGSGKLNTCDGTYTMLYKITVDEGSFGSFNFVLTKN